MMIKFQKNLPVDSKSSEADKMENMRAARVIKNVPL